MADFVPAGYEPAPKSSGGSDNYLNLKEPSTIRVRIMTPALVCYEAWTTDNKPVRKPKGEKWDLANYKGTPQECWAFVVYNYDAEKFQTFATTKKRIIQGLYQLATDPDWGNPSGYDIKLMRTGKTKDDTRYSLSPVAPKPFSPDLIKIFKTKTVDLTALYRNEAPINDGADAPKETQPGFANTDTDSELPF